MQNYSSIPSGFSLFQSALARVTSVALNDIKSLRNCHLFFTGCSAFFGKWLTECLLWANKEYNLGIYITLLTRDVNRFLSDMPHLKQHHNLCVMQGSATDLSQLTFMPFQFAIHGVNLPNDGSPTWAARHMHTAVHATEEIMCYAHACGCKTVLLISSGAIYRLQNAQQPPFDARGFPVSQDEPIIYGNTKRFLELYARSLGNQQGITVPIARLFAFGGAYTPLIESVALGSFVSQVVQNKPIVITGDGTPIRTYLDAKDMIVWAIAILTRGGNTEYNVGSTYPITIRELAELVLTCAHKSLKNYTILGKSHHGNAPSTYIPDTSCSKALHLLETISLTECIQEMLAWYTLRLL